jgi:hypothetical protein
MHIYNPVVSPHFVTFSITFRDHLIDIQVMYFIIITLQWLLLALLNPTLSIAKQNIKLLLKPSGPFAVAIKTMELTDTS